MDAGVDPEAVGVAKMVHAGRDAMAEMWKELKGVERSKAEEQLVVDKAQKKLRCMLAPGPRTGRQDMQARSGSKTRDGPKIWACLLPCTTIVHPKPQI